MDGLKRYITNAPAADVFMVFARTDPRGAAGQGHRGIHRARPAPRGGRRPARPQDGPGRRLDRRRRPSPGCGCPATRWSARRRGRVRHGDASLAHGRLTSRRCAWASRRGWSTRASSYARERTQGGRPDRRVPARPGHARRLADRVHGREGAGARRRGAGTTRRGPRLGPSAAKYFASEAVGRIADRAVQIHGGSGYIRGVAVERLYRTSGCSGSTRAPARSSSS